MDVLRTVLEVLRRHNIGSSRECVVSVSFFLPLIQKTSHILFLIVLLVTRTHRLVFSSSPSSSDLADDRDASTAQMTNIRP